MDLISFISVIAVFFVVFALCEPAADKLRMPYTVLLAIVGTLLGTMALIVTTGPTSDLLGPAAAAILDLPIRSNVFIYVLLPTLLFQVALGLNVRRMLDDWVPIVLMAILAVIVATFVIGFALLPFTNIPLVACLMLGAIVATTDPSAVVSIFRNTSAPLRLSRIVEGESLLNDAAAIALYGFFLTFVMWGVPNPTFYDALVQFPALIVGGIAFGWLTGYLGSLVMARLDGRPTAQLSISVALAYLTYIIGDQIVGVSGVIATVVSGLTLNWLAPGRLSPGSWTYLREVWDSLSHWATSFIFVLAAILVPRLMADARLTDVMLIGVVIVAAFVARGFMLFGLLPLLSWMKVSPRVELPYRLIIMWGGLRGAVTLALALAVTESARVPAQIQREVGIVATGFVLFTLLVQGTTLRWLIGKLKLDRLSPLDQALSNQVVAVALQNVREDMSKTTQRHELDKEVVRSEAKAFAARLDTALERTEAAEETGDRDRVTLGLVALAGRERDMILESFREQLLSARLVEHMLSDVDRVIESTRAAGRTGYRDAGRKSLGRVPRYKLAIRLHNWFGLSGLLTNMTADRFEILLNQRLILSDLHDYIDSKIKRIHGKRVAEILHEALKRREEETRKALNGLQLQYPSYAADMERRFIRRTALRLEEQEYQVFFSDRLIGREVHAKLVHGIQEERRRLDLRPRLDLAMEKTEFTRRFPIFGEMDDVQREQLVRALKTRYAEPGEVLMRRGDVARNVYFIASGAVEVEIASQRYRLGRGEIFGELALLTRRPRRGHITAITHCTLLYLDEAAFRKLLGRNSQLRATVQETAERRGTTLEF
jgi:monovalent cation:H+ antiporter, CPA1 family